MTGTTVGRTGRLGGGWGTSLRLFLVIIILSIIMIAIIILLFTIIVNIIIIIFILITCMDTRAEKWPES